MALPAVTRERVEGVCKELDVKYRVDEDGDIASGWINTMVWVHITERHITYTGAWRGRIVSSQDAFKALELCNDYNASSHGPKCYVEEVEGNESKYSIIKMELSHWTEPGMSDEQLLDYCKLGFGMILAAADHYEENFPQLVTWEDQED